MERNEKQTDGTTRNQRGADKKEDSALIRNTQCVGPISTAEKRRGSENSNPVVRASLVSPKPPSGGEPEERGAEVNSTESRRDVYGASGPGGTQKRQTAGGIGRALSSPFHPDRRLFYNQARLHRARDGQTPDQVYCDNRPGRRTAAQAEPARRH